MFTKGKQFEFYQVVEKSLMVNEKGNIELKWVQSYNKHGLPIGVLIINKGIYPVRDNNTKIEIGRLLK
jgi:hypothetical protein